MLHPPVPADDLGPQKTIYLRDHKAGLNALLVVDNVAAGPAIGGVRMAPDVTSEECARLARAMTLKNAAAGLPHGGGKSVISAVPSMPVAEKEALIRAFANAIRDVQDYIVGPDMGTDETCMGWIQDEIGRSVGLPRVIGGIPLDEIGATGFGVAVSAAAAEALGGVKVDGARVAIEGFGAVGRHAARFLADRGARLVAVSDSRGSITNGDGLGLDALCDLKAQGRSVTDLEGAMKLDRGEVLTAGCDILVPAARPDSIDMNNADRIRARLILQGANIPATREAEDALHRRGVLIVPDFIANAGGVICASVEYHGGSESQAMAAIEEKIARNTAETLRRSQADGILPRDAATAMANERLAEATSLRRFG